MRRLLLVLRSEVSPLLRRVALGCAAALLLGAHSPSWATEVRPSPEAIERILADSPCDFESRSLAVSGYHDEGQYALAYYHAAWLAWLGPGEFRTRPSGAHFLFDRDHRDRAAAQSGDDLAAALPAVAAQRMLADSCIGGTIAQQASRLRKDIAAMLERAQAAAGRSDPVARMALVQLALSLDDAILLDGGASDPSRIPLLRTAAAGAETVAAWLPVAPGPHRTLAIIRARLADMGSRAEVWQMAIAEAERARALDPSDPYLAELLWTLYLRVGDWQKAAVWQHRVEAAAERPADSGK